MRRTRITLAVLCLVAMLVPAVIATLGRHVDEARAPGWFGARRAALRRLPDPPADGNYRFAVLGDIQQGLSAYRASLRQLRGPKGIAFAVVCGDLVNRKSLPHYRVLFAAMDGRDPGFPVLTVPGNHDDTVFFEQHVGPRFWSARVGPDLLVGMDTSEIGSSGPFLELLRTKLAEEARHRFVFLHRPVARPGRWREKFAPLAEVLADGDVTAVFAGHLHHWESFELDGVLHVTNGRGGDLTGSTTSDAAVGIVTVTRGGVSAEMFEVGERSEILPILATGAYTRLWVPLGVWFTLGAAVLLGLAAVLLAPRGGRRIALVAAVFLGLPSTTLPIMILLACLLIFFPASLLRRRMTDS